MFYNNVFLFVGFTTFGTFIKFNWLFNLLSVLGMQFVWNFYINIIKFNVCQIKTTTTIPTYLLHDSMFFI